MNDRSHALIPHHVAIMMDGNRRWERKNRLLSLKNALRGHAAGAKVLPDIVNAAKERGIKILTVFAFSTENWLRPKDEIETIFQIIHLYLRENCTKMIDEGVKFDIIGDVTPLSHELKEEVERVKEATREGEAIELVMALNYGGRDDMRRAFIKIGEECRLGKLKNHEITEEMITRHLDTARYPEPDLLIRTSGEMRISNFLLWQLAYTEIYVTDVLWPDFTAQDLFKAMVEFQKRKRRMGR